MAESPDDFKLNKTFFEGKGGKITGRHFERVIEKTQEVEDKVKRIPGLHKLWTDIVLCLELVGDYRSGEYRHIAHWAIVAVVLGLLYLINPVELIPDVIPVVGYLDDVAVMVLILKLVRAELEEYAAWRKARIEYQEVLSRLFGDV